MIAPFSEKYSDAFYSKSITELQVGDRIILIMTQLDSMTGEYLGVAEHEGIRYFGIKAYGSQYVGASWVREDQIRSWNFVPAEVWELYYKFGELERTNLLKKWVDQIAVYEDKGLILRPDTVDGSKVKSISHGIGGLN